VLLCAVAGGLAQIRLGSDSSQRCRCMGWRRDVLSLLDDPDLLGEPVGRRIARAKIYDTSNPVPRGTTRLGVETLADLDPWGSRCERPDDDFCLGRSGHALFRSASWITGVATTTRHGSDRKSVVHSRLDRKSVV